MASVVQIIAGSYEQIIFGYKVTCESESVSAIGLETFLVFCFVEYLDIRRYSQ